jgi:PAS domain S-box-containing protein
MFGSKPPASTWLVPKGEIGQAIAAHPWEKTELGPLGTWSLPLRIVVNLMLDAGAPMALIWGPKFRFLYNERYAEMIQDKHPKALGGLSGEIFPELWQVLEPLFSRAMSGEAILVEDQELPITRNGVTKQAYFSFSYNPVRGGTGVVEGFLAVVIETTSRVVREQERAQMFDTVLSAITDFAYTFDRDGRFVYVNKALLDLWGLSLKDAVGKNFFDLKYPEELAAHLQRQIQQVIAEKTTIRDETPYVSPSGAEGYYEYIFSPVFGPDGSVVIVAGSTRDITDRKKLEIEALASSQAKDDFIATLSHELRTPLNPVLLVATDAAENMELSPEVRADFKSIADNVALEARLIDDLLDISRITHNKLQLELRRHDIHTILDKVIHAVGPELKGKELVFTRRFEASPSTVTGDEVRLQQIFSNLLRNAAKFTPRGGKVSVSTHVPPNKPNVVAVEITDTGIGLTAAELAKVFTPFAQGDHTADGASRFGGLGLGLAISRKVVELHSGSILARSPGRNHGATFIVELPLEASPVPLGKPEERPAARPPRARTASPRVLLVEDHDSSREALARLLAARNLSVEQASSAAEALEKAKSSPIDLVISDIGLPDTNGYELMKILKDAYGCGGIALSGYGTRRDIERSKEAGFMLHLTKPVQASALDDALRRFADSGEPA